MADNKKLVTGLCLVAATGVLAFAAARIEYKPAEPSETPAETAGTEGGEKTADGFIKATLAETNTGITVTKPDELAEKYPLQYESYMLNDENSEVTDYIEENPYIKTLYEGYGFAISYGSARGHTYDIKDLYETGRPHKLANCFTCKTSEFTAKVLNEGDSAYAGDFDAFAEEYAKLDPNGSDAFGCFHCHENEPGKMYVTHGYLSDALGADVDKVDARNLSCGQCHSEYFFDPETKATTLGYTSLEGANPDDILEFENNVMVKDDNGNDVIFADWVDESTGVRKLKAQHPEFETYMASGSIHNGMKLTCADCHMAKKTDANGQMYTDHNWVSPLKDETIMNDTCLKCHSSADEVKGMVEKIQKETRDSENELGNALEKLDQDLTAAIQAGTIEGEDLESCRLASRNAQWFWDFVFVENSEGVHNSTLTKHCFEQCQKYLDEANSYLS